VARQMVCGAPRMPQVRTASAGHRARQRKGAVPALAPRCPGRRRLTLGPPRRRASPAPLPQRLPWVRTSVNAPLASIGERPRARGAAPVGRPERLPGRFVPPRTHHQW
jgi:hypothetical protein